MPDGNTADATRAPDPCCCRARADRQPPQYQPQVQQEPCHLPTGSPPAPTLQQAEVKRPTRQMAISMATQGCHRQRIKLQQEGKRDHGEGG